VLDARQNCFGHTGENWAAGLSRPDDREAIPQVPNNELSHRVIGCAIEVHPIHAAQLRTYLRLSGLPLGLLLNFNAVQMKDGIVRVAGRAAMAPMGSAWTPTLTNQRTRSDGGGNVHILFL
jgi:hypothetical protein